MFKIMNNQRQSGILCAVPSCKASKRTHPSRMFFGFPLDQKLHQIWLEKCGLKSTSSIKRLKICEKHFNSQRIGKRKLVRNSIPEYNLNNAEGSNEIANDSSDYTIVNIKDIVENPTSLVKSDLYKKKYYASLSTMRILLNKIKSYIKKIKYYKHQMHSLKNKVKKYQTKKSTEDQIDSKEIVKMILSSSLKTWPCTKCMENLESKNDIINLSGMINSDVINIVEEEGPIGSDSVNAENTVSNNPSETGQQFEDSSRYLMSLNCGNGDESQESIEQSSWPIINLSGMINSDVINIVEEDGPIGSDSVNGENTVSNNPSETGQQFEDSSRDLVSLNCGNGDESQESIEQSSWPREIQYECEKCGLKEDTYKELIYHMRVHPKIMLYECERCGKEFHQYSRYFNHSYMHKEDTSFKCTVCQKGFKGLRYLQQHELTHKTEKIYQCPNCDKWFCHMKGLNQHSLCHKEKLISCTECTKKFQFNSQLKLHMKLAHSLRINKTAGKLEHCELEKQFTCEICGKSFVIAQTLRLHFKNIHNKTRTDSTYRKPRTKNSLTNSKIDEELLKYKCEICGKAFKVPFFLKNHMITHSGVKEFVCAYCGKAFAFKMYLERHIRLMHDTTNPKNSVCGICGKVSADHANYRLHMLAHTGEMPFQCKFCDIKFRYAKSLRMHVNKKHEKESKLEKSVVE